MTTAPTCSREDLDGRAFAWAHAAALAAADVPADGAERVAWTVRGWAETALGCVVCGSAVGFDGLDDVVRLSGIPCAGPFAERLRRLRGLGGVVPPWYRPEAVDLSARTPLAPEIIEPCFGVAEYCDAVDLAVSGASGVPGSRDDGVPGSATTADHLRWSEPHRAAPADRRYPVLDVDVSEDLIRRSWMRLPLPGPGIVLINPAERPAGTMRQRVRQGVHNGAHLDHLAALTEYDVLPVRHPSPIEFGTGLMTAEAFAMSVEIMVTASCLIHGQLSAAGELHRALVSRMGRIPGFKEWRAAHPTGPRALGLAEHDQVREFRALPTLAGTYIAGPLRLIGSGWADPLIPVPLAARMRDAWELICDRFEPAARLTARAVSLLG